MTKVEADGTFRGAVRRSWEYLEEVSTQLASFKLLGSYPAYELIKVELAPEARLTMTPRANSNQILHIISGCLRSDTRGLLLRAGGSFSGIDLDEPVIFEADELTTLLYVTTEHEFHTLSDNLYNLRQLAVEVELKDGYTADHCVRLQTLSYATGKRLGLTQHQLLQLDYGAYLHDVGKIKVPLSILTKPGKLTLEERQVINRHPSDGYALLAETFMKDAARIVEQHHERLDGSGYPFGLEHQEIMPEAMIVAVVDSFDAMTSNRSYQRARSPDEALAELERLQGVHYDAATLRAFKAALYEESLKLKHF